MNFTTEELIFVTNAKVLKNNTNGRKFSISTDTRTINSENIYIGLKGENFDGETFISKAVEAGARAYFTTSGTVIDDADLILQIENPIITYLQLAKLCLNKISPKVIALTGSSGKTTTKEMLTTVCRQEFRTYSTWFLSNNSFNAKRHASFNT